MDRINKARIILEMLFLVLRKEDFRKYSFLNCRFILGIYLHVLRNKGLFICYLIHLYL